VIVKFTIFSFITNRDILKLTLFIYICKVLVTACTSVFLEASTIYRKILKTTLKATWLCIFLHVLQVTNIVNDCSDFLRYSTKGFIVLAAFEVVGVNSSEDFKNKTQNLESEFPLRRSSTSFSMILSLCRCKWQRVYFYDMCMIVCQ
jgi:hypothetical protein